MKINSSSLDIKNENIQSLKTLFPEAFVSGKLDLELLGEILGEEVEESTERYGLSWRGKQKAKQIVLQPTTSTLEPVKEESSNWENTKNVFIEGDNLEVLKVLQRSYKNQVKMIYIDPPYNTGNDFVYSDDFSDNLKNYLQYTGQVDEEGKKLSTNTENDGRYHDKWLSMMYPRLKLARNLLRDDGVIFISIDDHEVHNLRYLCDEIFGSENFVGTFIKQSKVGGGSDSKHIVKEHEYGIVYSKNKVGLEELFLDHNDDYLKRYKEADENGKYFWDTFARPGLKNPISYVIKAPDGTDIDGKWIRSEKRFKEDLADEKVRIVKKEDGGWSVQFKQYLNEDGKKPRSMTTDFGGTVDGKNSITELFQTDKIFSYPKSPKYLSQIFQIFTYKNSIILDFFAGSGTTAQAVMKLNAKDEGKRKFICVQLPEPLEEDNKDQKEAWEYCKNNNLPRNIASLSKERIKKAAEKIARENPLMAENMDLGFRVFRLSDTAFYKWQAANINKTEDLLTELDKMESESSQASTDKVFYETLLKEGVDLALTPDIKESQIAGKNYCSLDNGETLICFEKNLEIDFFDAVVALIPKPTKILCLDESFNSDEVKVNAEHLMEKHNIKFRTV